MKHYRKGARSNQGNYFVKKLSGEILVLAFAALPNMGAMEFSSSGSLLSSGEKLQDTPKYLHKPGKWRTNRAENLHMAWT